MNLNEYQILVARTANTDLDPKLRLAVATLGLIGEMEEAIEADAESAKLELGDCWWYMAEIHTCLGWNLGDVIKYPGHFDDEILVRKIPLAEAVKKHIAHGRGPEHIRDSLYWVARDLWLLAARQGLNGHDILEANIEKLKRRHPDGFSTQYMDEEMPNDRHSSVTLTDFQKEQEVSHD